MEKNKQANQREGPGKKQSLRIEKIGIIGMHCASCVTTIENAAKKAGAKKVEVSLASSEGVIEVDDPEAVRRVFREIRKTGYEVEHGKLILRIPSLTRPDEEPVVEKILLSITGVLDAVADSTRGIVRVYYNPRTTTPEELVEKLRNRGYEASVLEEESVGERLEESRLAQIRRVFLASIIPSLALMFYLLVLPRLTPNPPLWEYRNIIGFVVATLVLATAGLHFLKGAYRAARNKSAGMDTLVSLGMLSAYLYSVAVTVGIVEGETFYEAAAVVPSFVMAGRYLEEKMKTRATGLLKALSELSADKAIVVRDGEQREIPASQLRPGDHVLVRQGDKIPADGVVMEGRAEVSEAFFTGEPGPVEKTPGKPVLAGGLVLQGHLVFKATRVGRDTLLSQVAELVSEALSSKPHVQRMVDRISGVFAFIVIGIAVAVFTTWNLVGAPLSLAVMFASSVLLISCPCALGLATPTVVSVALEKAARMGILVRNAEALEKLPRVNTVFFDKTGTLTLGEPRVVHFELLDSAVEREVLELVQAVEERSNHPLARAIVDYARSRNGASPPSVKVEQVESIPGAGIVGVTERGIVGVGNEELAKGMGASLAQAVKQKLSEIRSKGMTAVLVILGDKPVALMGLLDKPRPDARKVVEYFRRAGVKTVMLTGDKRETAERIASELGLDEVRHSLAPEDKVEAVKEEQAKGRVVAMVGDGVNDAPSLARADVGIAMGGGTSLAQEAGDITILDDKLENVARAHMISRETLRRIKLNLAWAFVYNITLIPVAAGVLYPSLGLALRPEMAAIAMSLSSVSVTGMALLFKRWSPRGL